MAELDTNALALACQQPAAEDAGMKPPPPASIPPPTPLKRKASTDLKDSYSGKKENPLLLSDSDGASESELSEPDDDLIVMSPEKPSASSQPQAGPSSIKPSGPTKPRKKASTDSQTAEQRAARLKEKERKEKAKAQRLAEREAKAAKKKEEDEQKASRKAKDEAEKAAKKAEEEALKATKKAERDALAAKKAEEDRVKAERKAQRDAERAEVEAARLAKKRERDERDRVREEEERRRLEVKGKQIAAFTGFFKKKEEPVARKRAELKTVTKSDFERTFLPFEDKRGIIRAPINRFLDERRRLASDGIVAGEAETVDVSSPQTLLRSFLATVPPLRIPTRLQFPSPLTKSGPPRASVRDVFARSQEAEISGSGDPHKILAELRDPRWFKRKHLQFREDTRPAYNGTWTQSSNVVGPRTPFAKDTLLFDYAYDSGEEWEEPEEGGEDLESLSGDSPRKSAANDNGAGGGSSLWDTDSEDGDFASGSDEDDSEAEGFVVSDEEEDAEATAAGPSTNNSSPSKGNAPEEDEVQLISVAKKRKKAARRERERQSGSGGKRRKELNVLVPVVKGPFFEETIGVCGWDGFDAYRVQFLNDTPTPIDPFTYVAQPILQPADPAASPEKTAGVASAIPRHLVPLMPPPPLPQSLSAVSSATALGPASAAAAGLMRKPHGSKKAAALASASADPTASSSTPKKVEKRLPLAHLPRFLELVAASTRSQILLQAELHDALKPLGVTKAEVTNELKIRAKRVGKADGSPWAIEPSAWADAGLPIPANAVNMPGGAMATSAAMSMTSQCSGAAGTPAQTKLNLGASSVVQISPATQPAATSAIAAPTSTAPTPYASIFSAVKPPPTAVDPEEVVILSSPLSSASELQADSPPASSFAAPEPMDVDSPLVSVVAPSTST